jgi:hypothetical protein
MKNHLGSYSLFQCSLDYGDNDNYVYFINHGFIMQDNPFDCVWINLPSIKMLDPEHQKLFTLFHVPDQVSGCFQANAMYVMLG